MDIKKIKQQALKEIEEEHFTEAVEDYKEKLRNKKSVWDILFPYRILIIKKRRG